MAKSKFLSNWIFFQGFVMLSLLNKYKTIFLENQGKFWNSPKTGSLCWNFVQVCFEVCQNPWSNLLTDWILVPGLLMQSLVNEYKTIFPGKWEKRLNSSKNFYLYCTFLYIYFEDYQKRKLNLLVHGILLELFRMPNLVNEYKTNF